MQASPTYNLHTRKNRLPSNRPICAHLRSSADKNGLPARTSSQSLFSTGFWQTADIDDIRFTGSNLKTTTSFTYNNANELTSMTATPGGTTTFTYDDWGRMTQKANSGFTADYAYRYGSMLYNVDSDFPGEGEVTYEYGGDKNRRKTTIGSDITKYRWDSGLSLLNEEDNTGNLLSTYIAGTLAKMKEGTYYYFHHDILGSTRLLSNSGKNAIADLDYDPYGRVSYQGGIVESRLFTSHDMKTASGHYYTFYRYYDPKLSRWLTRDPFSYADGPNLFNYSKNDPVNSYDQFGGLSGSAPGCPIKLCRRPLADWYLRPGWIVNKDVFSHQYFRYHTETLAPHRDAGGEMAPEAKPTVHDKCECKHMKHRSTGRMGNKSCMLATCAEKWQCLKNSRTIGDYSPAFNNCQHQCGNAARDCCLDKPVWDPDFNIFEK